MKLKYKKKKSKFFGREIIIIVSAFVLSIILIYKLEKNVNKYMIPIGEMTAKKIMTNIINSSVYKIRYNDNLFSIKKNNNNEIELINYNSVEISKLINNITYNIEEEINNIENNKSNLINYKNGIIAKVSLISLFDNSLINSIGPKLSIKLNFMGNVVNKIDTVVKPYGINNSYIEVRINIMMTGMIVMPFASKEIVIENTIPISMNIIQGNVPKPYVYSYK